MDETNLVIDAIQQTDTVVESLWQNAGAIGSVLGALGLGVGASKRAGGARFVALTEAIHHVATVVRATGETVGQVGTALGQIVGAIAGVFAKLAEALEAIYRGIKAQQANAVPPAPE